MAYNKEIYFIRHGKTNANLERRGQDSESVLYWVILPSIMVRG